MKNLLDNEIQKKKNTHLDHAEELVFIQAQKKKNVL